MRKLTSFLFILIISFSSGIAQTTQWVKTAGGLYSDKGINIGVDSLGFVYIGGYFNGSANFGPYTVMSSDTNVKNLYVAKMDSNGTFLWATSGGGVGDDRILGIHVDPAGNIYSTGTYWSSHGPAIFGNISLSTSSSGYDQSFLAKMDANGNWLWAKEFGAPAGGILWPTPTTYASIGDDHGYDLKTDDLGDIYVTGWWSGDSAYFDSFALYNPSWNSDTTTMAYVGKLDATGNFLWVKQFDGVDDIRGERDNRLAIDKDRNVYVTGGFKNTGVYGSHTLVSRGSWDIYVTKLNTDGDFIWARRAGSVKGDRGNGIAIADDGDIYIDGEFREDADFGYDNINHKSRKDIFVAKLKPNGDWVWAKRVKKSAGKDKANQMAVDKDEYVFVCGEIGDTAKFGDTLINNLYDDQNPFVAQLNVNGKWLWAKTGGSPSPNERANDVVVDKWGNSYIVGYYEGTANFDGHIISAQGKKDIFIWKIDKFIDPNPVIEEEPPIPIEPAFPPAMGIHVPEAFSPNGDGNNDFLMVYGGQIESLVFQVYERGGYLLFRSTNQTKGWDGTINGSKAMSGVYVYSVQVVYWNGEKETKVGNFTLVR